MISNFLDFLVCLNFFLKLKAKPSKQLHTYIVSFPRGQYYRHVTTTYIFMLPCFLIDDTIEADEWVLGRSHD
jgi:hypothetical protein